MTKHKSDDQKQATRPTLSIPNLTIRPIEASKLISNQAYQRAVNQRNCAYIKQGYIKELVNPVKVSLRNGKYYVFDGQHTLTVLTEMFGENCIIPCLVYTGLTYEREAELFAKQDEFKKKLSSREKIKAKYEAKDADATTFMKAVESCGYKCTFTSGHYVGTLASITYLFETVYKRKGVDHLKRLLTIIKSAWPDDKNATNESIVKGVDMFITLYDGEFTAAELVAKLQKVAPIVLIRNGKADMTHSGATRYAVQVFDYYNKGRKTGKLRSRF